MRLASAVLLVLGVAGPALAQERLTEAEGRAVWREQSAAILEDIITLATTRACKIVNDDDAKWAMQKLEGRANNVFWRTPGISMSVPDQVMVEDIENAEKWGWVQATPQECNRLRGDPAITGNLKSWVGRLSISKF